MQALAEFEEVRRLLLDPTPANVTTAQVKLEAIAGVVRRVLQAAESEQPQEDSLREAALILREETLRVRGLLESAAKFFNSMSSLRFAAQYQSDGCLLVEPRGLRTLAQL